MRSYLAPAVTINEMHADEFPCVSIILPFEPKMNLKSHLQLTLKIAVQKVRNELMSNYTIEKVNSIMHRLQDIISNLDYRTYKRSIAIFLSPQLQKVYYLDVLVNEKIVVDESFEIRDLVYNKKEQQKFLLLVLSAGGTRIYLGNFGKLVRIISNIPDRMEAFKKDLPEKTGNFSDPSYKNEVLLDKFLRHTDAGLGIILKVYPLPLFVMGDERILGHFRELSRNVKYVIDYVHGDLVHASEMELRKAIQPYIADWNRVRQNDLLNQLELAQGDDKLVSGITKVWEEAMHKRGRILVVEKNYMVPARKLNNHILDVDDPQVDEGSYIKDAVDDIIEKVLEMGGDVEFVEDGLLEEYDRIALILYY
jgi:flagellin-specific chaperone FliS